MKTLSNEYLTIRVSGKGAELCSLFSHDTQSEYLWQADPTYWNRHSPVLFPIVGSVWENQYRYQGQTYYLSQHGFARDREFELILGKEDELRYRLVSNEETRKVYPFDFCLEIGYRLQGKQVEVIWNVQNPAQEKLFFQIGAHPAFYYPDFHTQDQIHGYFGFDRTEDLSYILISEKGCADPHTSYSLILDSNGQLPIDTHTFDKDALILENSQLRRVALYDLRGNLRLSLRFDAPVVGLWSPPGKNAPFVCIEPWYGRCDRAGFTGTFDRKDWIQSLESGEAFQASYTIEIHS
ncbi:MAG: aldose 1-epimerase family protein [Bacteroides sp.]|nr:aldose 1-epimerase family protein [Bacteroides sp.]